MQALDESPTTKKACVFISVSYPLNKLVSRRQVTYFDIATDKTRTPPSPECLNLRLYSAV